jgi:transitional endoplasmic reticulum ATPase
MVALRRILPEIRFEAERKPILTGVAVEVTSQDFLEAFKAVEPTATREFLAERPRVKLRDVGGLEGEKRTLRSIVDLVRSGGAMLPAHFDPPKGILFTGASGTGKKLLAHAIAGELGLTLLSVDQTSLLSKWVGESEKGVRDVFKRAKQASPCILFFDDIDGLAPARAAQEAGSLSPRIVGQLLRELDELQGRLGVVVLGATNRPDLIDPALLRPGRFDYVLDLPQPSAPERLEILALQAEGLPLEPDVDLAELAQATEGFTGADLKLVCKKAAILALDQSRAKPSRLTLRRAHFQEALGQIAAGDSIAPTARFLGGEGRRSAG